MLDQTLPLASAEGQGFSAEMDPATLAVLSNRFEAIVREMTNTMLRSARSTVIAISRDFSCAVLSADNELIASAEGLPVHVFGSHLQTEAMVRLHSDLREGDAFLDNDPYVGNTHHADHTILVPIFIEGSHAFTAVCKAHQADVGCSQATTYMAWARDVYEEGSLSFPCVRIQRDYEDVDDIIRMCRRRIRVPEQWYGDYLATLGAARIAERRIKELVSRHGLKRIQTFVREWLDYSERRAKAAIGELPSGKVRGSGQFDSFGTVGAIPLNVEVAVDADNGRVTVDLTKNIDSVDAGINQSRATAANSAVAAVLNVLDPDLPINHGIFRRIEVLLRENCVAGITMHPRSCAAATALVGSRIMNMTQRAFAEIAEGCGAAESGGSIGAALAVIAGHDWRIDGPYINELMFSANGGPASHCADGWLTWLDPAAAGLQYSDSVEVDESRYPIMFSSFRVIPDSGGFGKFRGAPAGLLEYGPRRDEMTVALVMDFHETPPAGVRGGGPGSRTEIYRVFRDGRQEALAPVGQHTLRADERLRGLHAGGGGYGNPLERDPDRVVADVRRQWVSLEAARNVYGVCLSYDDVSGWSLDAAGTAEQRALLASQQHGSGIDEATPSAGS